MVTCAAAIYVLTYPGSRTEQNMYERMLDKTMKLLITKVDIRKHPNFSDYLDNL